jgi:uncharacterized membrane protein YeiH
MTTELLESVLRSGGTGALANLFGVFVFALSGGLAAARKRMDLFGFVVVALLPAVGGGTLRDVVLGTDVFWIADTTVIWVTVLAAVVAFLFSERIERQAKAVAWCDAIGLALFTVLGASKALAFTDSATIAVMMGVTTAVAGGLIRDVVCNDLPLVLHREIYATAAFLGAAVYVVAVAHIGERAALWAGALSCFVMRAAGILFGWSLPRPGARSA